MWYTFPQVQGLGFSEVTKFYALQNLADADEYLKHPLLGFRLNEICQELSTLASNDASAIFCKPDDLKLKSSMTLFTFITKTNKVFQSVLHKFFDGTKDANTLKIIGR